MADREKDPWEQFPDAPAAAPAVAASPWDAFPDAKGPGAAFAQPKMRAAHPEGFAPDEHDTRGMMRRAYDAVVGRQDPAHAHLPTMEEVLLKEEKERGGFFRGPEMRHINASAPFAVSDESYGDVMAKAIGDRFVRHEKDKYGYPIIVYKGPEGERRAYVNRPGLDSEDVARGIMQSLPYVGAAALTGGAAPAAGLMGRTVLQGGAAALTSAGQDVAAQQFGSEQGVDPAKAAIMGLTAGAGEVLSVPIAAAWRKLVTIPGLVSSEGQLTQRGMNVAIEAGLDPSTFTAEMARKMAKSYATSGDAAMAGREIASTDLGIHSTLGQRTKNPAQLLEEGAIRKGLRGEEARRAMQAFDEQQLAQVRNAAMGHPDLNGAGNRPGSQGIGASLHPDRTLQEFTPQELGTGIQEGLRATQQTAKEAEGQLWQGLRNITTQPEAMELLPQFIGPVINSRELNPTVTPMAYQMAETLARYVTGETKNATFSALGQTASRPTVDGMRRQLGEMVGSAAPGADKSAAGEVYRAFNDWIGAAAERQLLSGHPDAAAALRGARQISRDIKDLFQPRGPDGRQLPASTLIQKVMNKADSPEAVVDTLIGTPASKIKVGVPDALGRMKTALERFGGPEGQGVWNDIRAAYWSKMVTDAKGGMMTPQGMLTSMEKAFERQGTIINKLYSPAEQAEMRKLMASLRQITYKDPNPSGSGYAIAQFAKDFLGKVLDFVPGAHKVTIPLKIAYNMTGASHIAEKAAGRAAMRVATGQGSPAPAPRSLAGIAAAGQNLYRNNKD